MCSNLHLSITANFLSHSMIWNTLTTALVNLFQYQKPLKHLIHQFTTFSMICSLITMIIASLLLIQKVVREIIFQTLVYIQIMPIRISIGKDQSSHKILHLVAFTGTPV